MKRFVVVYRGPLEKMRTAFLIDTFYNLFGSFDFIWIYPVKDGGVRAKYFESTIAVGKVNQLHIIEDKITSFYKTRNALHQIFKKYDAEVLGVIGFSALAYLPDNHGKQIVWCVNGVPEEDVLSRPWSKLLVKFKKWMTLNRKVDLILVVSERMKRYMKAMYPAAPIIVAPCCVDTQLYFKHRRPVEQRIYFSYLGSGAPWQNIDRISGIWQKIHQLDKSIRFRVISQDPKSKILATNISESNIEFHKSSNFDVVADLQSENEVGFLIRDNIIVNQVSYPMKMGEYLASGSWVVASNIDWDLSDFIHRHSCGLLIDNESSDEEIAKSILDFKKRENPIDLNRYTENAAKELDRFRWAAMTANNIKSILNI
jgi:glycosyltransferase involved in cell wall biosynthesis